MFYETKKDLGLYRVTIGCPRCGCWSKKNGCYRSGKRRYLCLNCRLSFFRSRRCQSSFKHFRQFYQLITGRVNRLQLLNQNRQSRKTLSVAFRPFFLRPLTAKEVWAVLPPDLTKPWVYGVDGKWLKRLGVFLLHRNVTTGENLYWSFHPGETYPALLTDMAEFMELLGKTKPEAVISDWKGAIVNAVTAAFGDIPHQRCLTHVTRTMETLLPQKSLLTATLELRTIGERLIKINSWFEVKLWLKRLDSWYCRYGHLLKERTKNPQTKRGWWYTHGNLRRAWRLLTDNSNPFFQFLDHPILPKSNNSLEGTFSQAVNKLINHRGMKLNQQVAFLNWYFAFTRMKGRADLFKLWAYWKRRL